MVKILTEREKEIISKKMRGVSLTQNESNILSRCIRPKLKEIRKINPDEILNKIEYSQKARSVENKIKKIVLNNVPKADSIIICGSAVQTNYREYNDIDVIIATKKMLANNVKKKLIGKMRKEGKKENLNLDIQIYAKSSILSQYPHNPSLIYQLKDSKVIYGKLKIPNKITLSRLDLKMKLDWSEGMDIYSKADEIYYAIRNVMLVLLLMNKNINNYKLRENLIEILGADLLIKLKTNTVNKLEKKLALNYLNLLTLHLENELKNPKWEKIEIKNP